MSDLQKVLTALENKFWEADINNNANFYGEHTTNNSFAVGPSGISNKKNILKAISSNSLKLLNYKIRNPKAVSFTKRTALLIYESSGTTLNKGKKSKFSMLTSSLYVKSKNKWLAAFHQQTPFK